MRHILSAIVLVSVLWLSAQPATAQASSSSPATPYEPLVPGWERFLAVTWEPFERRGQPYVGGYVVNNWGSAAMRVQLLVDALDSSGRVVSQSVSWLGSPISPGSRGYFEVPAPQRSASYRVRVFAFDWLQAAAIQAP